MTTYYRTTAQIDSAVNRVMNNRELDDYNVHSAGRIMAQRLAAKTLVAEYLNGAEFTNAQKLRARGGYDN